MTNSKGRSRGPKTERLPDRSAIQSSEVVGAQTRYNAMYESILEYRKVLEEEWLWARHYVGCLDEDLDEADWQIEECLGDESQKVHGATEIPA